jgi:molybdopterin synthase sulfur carrier subunit
MQHSRDFIQFQFNTMATVIIPTPLRKFTNGTSGVLIQASTLPDVIQELVEIYPDLTKYLLDPDGKIAPFISVFIGSDNIRHLDLEQAEVKENTVISIVSAIAGG